MKLYFASQPNKVLKKLPENQRRLALRALQEVERDPFQGEPKVGDLAGFYTYRFRIFDALWLIGYEFTDWDTIKIVKIGPRENFYRGL